ncbi:uncharacterized protein [Penaeus vannamei]|uniref:uncharacterized protein n=1 Tax=Penaeus vannamei TaxID=6689 RepID=UPI00387F536E
MGSQRRLLTRCCCLAILSRLCVQVAGSPLLCRAEGRFPHPDDCGRYVDCIPSGAGREFFVREGQCPGYPFSPSLRRCVPREAYPGCVPEAPRASFRHPELDYLCARDAGAVGCFNCKLAYSCVDGRAHLRVCGGRDTCSDHPAFGSGACLPQDQTVRFSQKCLCSPTALTPDSYNSSYYIGCEEAEGPLKVESCPLGQIFSEEAKACRNAPPKPCAAEPGTPPCGGKTGTRVNPKDCRWSYTCLPNGAVRTSCCKGASQYFDEESLSCVEACSILRPLARSSLCPGFGLMKDPKDCTKYHLCLAARREPFRSLACSAGSYYDEATRRCRQGDVGRACVASAFDYTSCPQNHNITC